MPHKKRLPNQTAPLEMSQNTGHSNMEKAMQEIKDRFMSKVEMVTESGCWIWMASTLIPSAKSKGNRVAYGCFTVGKKSISAHRASYKFFVGYIPDGMSVCHSCDIPLCVNPSHLFIGSHKDNMQDMVKKGRAKQCVEHQFKRGHLHHSAKLTLQQVCEIRESTGSLRSVAAKFNVTKDAIWAVRKGITWNL